jgi:PAS domain S-box-containing protein
MERFELLINNFENLNNELKIVSNQLKKESKDVFNAIVENSPNFIAIVQDGKYVFVNSCGLKLLRCKSSVDIIGKQITETIAHEFREYVYERLSNVREEQRLPVHIKLIRQDGSSFFTESNSVPFIYNKKPAVLIIGRDITSELENKSKIEQEEKLRTDILNSFKEVIAFYSPAHSILWLNNAGKEQLNIKDDSYIGKKCYKVWFNGEKPCATCPVVHNKYETTERIVTFPDKRIWRIRHIPLFSIEGDLTGYIEFREDITEKENIKVELEKSYSRQIRAEIANLFGHFENNLTTGQRIWSHGAFNILGIPYNEILSVNNENFIDYIHPEDKEQIKYYLELAYKNQRKFDRIYRIIDANNKEKTIRGIGEIKTDPASGHNIFFGVVQDITHISNLEKQIFDEREKYKMLAENAPFGLILTHNFKTVYVNKTCMIWLGIDSISDFEESNFVAYFHNNDRKIAERLLNKMRNSEVTQPVVEKLRLNNKQGEIRYIRFDLKNNVINHQKYIQTVLTDITDDVLKEKKQKQVAADALYINQKNSMLSEIECVLQKTLSDPKLSKHNAEFNRIFEIINNYKQLDKDWKMLISNFEEVHPGFFKKLTDTYPLLSPNDIKHCACIKMNFDTKEIARFFNIKMSSVQISRVRLKKKMNLSDSVDLRTFLLNF